MVCFQFAFLSFFFFWYTAWSLSTHINCELYQLLRGNLDLILLNTNHVWRNHMMLISLKISGHVKIIQLGMKSSRTGWKKEDSFLPKSQSISMSLTSKRHFFRQLSKLYVIFISGWGEFSYGEIIEKVSSTSSWIMKPLTFIHQPYTWVTLLNYFTEDKGLRRVLALDMCYKQDSKS